MSSSWTAKPEDYPGPGMYEVQSSFNQKGKTITPSRGSIYTNKSNPGPGQYELPGAFDSSKGFSLSPRFKDKKKEVCDFPGPGKYNPEPIKTKKTVPTIRPKKEEDLQNNIPGPGHYPVGSTFNSKAPTFSKRYSRNIKERAPGPGAYDTTSPKSPRSPRYSIKAKNSLSIDSTIPGPGQYSMNDSIGTGPKFSFKGFH
eukprot:TRINITY_DN2761_c0_g3_i1.p1 TRINITY_DN2761_c0_g3~~TRINITY_DN2761_c0_g3_i1.p1  ORF type:complete len:210 (+),score=52.92 TRINITY_DN2761_c0_g3_i1:35-631(+)